MEKANQKFKDSTFNEELCKGPTGPAFTTPAASRPVTNCKAGRELDCPCSGLARLETDLGINGGTPNKIFASQVAEDITPAEAAAMIEANKGNGSLVLLDVSTRREYHKWHVEKAININIFSLKFSEKLKKLDKERTYLVYCKMGGRSAAAQKVMIKQGFQKVFNIVGGRDRWRVEELPYGSGLASHARARTCPVLMTINAVARLRAKLKGLLGASRRTGEIVNH